MASMKQEYATKSDISFIDPVFSGANYKNSLKNVADNDFEDALFLMKSATEKNCSLVVYERGGPDPRKDFKPNVTKSLSEDKPIALVQSCEALSAGIVSYEDALSVICASPSRREEIVASIAERFGYDEGVSPDVQYNNESARGNRATPATPG